MKKNHRHIIQTVFFLISIGLLIYIALGKNYDVVHEFCPFSKVCFGLRDLFTNPFFMLFFVKIVGILILISAFFFGRWFCSHVCYLGSLQEFIYAKTPFKKYRRIKIPYKLHSVLKHLKYVVLLCVAAMTMMGMRQFVDFCPQYIIVSIAVISRVFIIYLGFIIISSFFVERIWCRYLCPFGALQAISIKIGAFLRIKRHLLRRDKTLCNFCGRCNIICPMQNNILKDEFITSPECIGCNKCVYVCKEKKALKNVWK